LRSLPRPPFTHRASYAAATERFKDLDLQTRFQEARSTIELKGDEYIAKGVGGKLHNVDEEASVSPLSNQDLYERGLLRRRSNARQIYERIKISAKRVCPVCNHRAVASLDHYLPKAKFGAFVVHPDNLIPSCYECNFGKRANFGTSYAATPLHPYFDDLGSGDWLTCELVKERVYFGKFAANQLALSPKLFTKLTSHITAFAIDELYKVESAAELARSKALHISIGRQGVDALSDYLQRKADSIALIEPNSWRSVLYAACARDSGFLIEMCA
jgi:hypothetical protein